MANAYGNYADVLDPVKIVTQVVGIVSTEEYLRNYCIISTGDSTLNSGEVQLVTQATYQNYLLDTAGADSELEKAIKGYFATSGQFCFILEVGASSLINDVKAQVDILENYINLHPKKMYMYRVPSSWYYPSEDYKIKDDTKPALRVTPTDFTLVSGGTSTFSVINNGTISYTWAEGYDTYFIWDESNLTVTALDTQTTTDKDYTLTLKVTMDNGEELTTNLTFRIGDATAQSGVYEENLELTRDLAFLNLTAQQQEQHFIVSGNKQMPDADAGWQLYKGKENVMVVYDNSNTDANGFPLDTAIMGIMGSTSYDITSTNGLTPLNNKSLAGIAYSDLGYTIGEQLIQAPQNIMGDFASNTVLFNGLYADGRSFEFRYAIDLMNYELDLALKGLLYNSANVSTYTLTYDQNGIDTINATICAVLNRLKEMNVINTYAASYNTTTKTMEYENYINCIEFYTYKAAYPENYAAGIYGGISFYVLIQGFIKEVNLNITIE